MNEKKQKPIRLEDIQKMEGEEKLKYEIAEELGLLDKVLEGGWRALTSKETGRIGGIISKKRKDDLKN
ncbi:MAG: small, acid-soluble spore protein, alpha/beta type [Coprococcus sp.]|nr:small, acid-soluble spore protein, alpha/beta type [Coprococcus sp.]